MTEAETALIVLASVQGAFTVALVLATAFYAVRTHDISKAAREQADASVKMAQVMREERLAADQPYLLIEVEQPTPVYDAHGDEDSPAGLQTEVDVSESYRSYPKKLAYKVFNAGRGPATEISTTLLHSAVMYDTQMKDVLRPDTTWDVKVVPNTPTQAILTVFEGKSLGSEELGFNAWMKKAGLAEFEPHPSDSGVIVTYRDIQGNRWLTYLRMHVDPVVALNHLYRMIRSGEQRLTALSHRDNAA